ncbi:hypothetical protein EJ02DRAFT_474773 [Clathrospora elynae]|uniref:Uncharacterized protein n=1 Tax=Clathrospora elynae TaxID=706981 RepID=A0A6A5T4B5_9PLEO|nr:hypothetical protein EJ02DRAFT_474773 [Clathrospora elynae]
MGMSDLQHMVDFYRVEEDRRVRSMIGFGPGEKTKGLRVNCWGDLAVFKSYVYEPVEIDTSDQEGEVALPITCKDRLSTSHEYFDGHILQYHTNEERHELLLGKGTVLVTRQDKKPLHPLHLNAMTEYFAVKFNGVVDACIAGDDPATLSRYLASLSKEDFLQSYVEFLAKLKTSHPDIDLANLPSPYDI